MIKHVETEIKMPLMMLPVRSTLVKYQDRGILLSPGSRMTTDDYAQLGKITDLVATNTFHVAGIRKALEFFPRATVWIPTGAKINFESPNIKILGRDLWPYTDAIQIIEVKGMPKINEFLFYIKETKSLFVTDLFFNLLKSTGIGSMIILSMFGTYKKFGLSRFLNKFITDKEAFQNSIRGLKEMDLHEIIPSHGDILKENIASHLESALLERGYSI